ncbi:organelle RRM domain-containing protein 2, mitochondrial-like isoform X3 [Cornus florida]|uniref:organelle RRM domain-containing protein 2, mitochondrial-like isoform X3 n=1 Tax=Cornus florida TaxID=4283 RepID=UPI002899D2A0|nr:organelle RRM domain-containing protein 2, mitochondrial-like isoform X3 [Cornus florida]
MAMRAAAVAVVKPRGLRRLFCTQTFVPSRSPPVEPSTQLLVTDLSKRTTSDRLKEAFSKFGVVVDVFGWMGCILQSTKDQDHHVAKLPRLRTMDLHDHEHASIFNWISWSCY